MLKKQFSYHQSKCKSFPFLFEPVAPKLFRSTSKQQIVDTHYSNLREYASLHYPMI